MARLHEYQGKILLKEAGITIPEGRVVESPQEAQKVAEELGSEVVLKAMVWITGRLSRDLIQFAQNPQEAFQKSLILFGKKSDDFEIKKILVERKLIIDQEFYASLIINDKKTAPIIIFSTMGGSGIEDITKEYPDKLSCHTIEIIDGFKDFEARNLLSKLNISGTDLLQLSNILIKLWETAQKYDARSLEINPLVKTSEANFIAADCRITIDDYAVFRHPELEIDIARELNRPPTALDLIAYNVEKNDYRGTFYFIQMAENFTKRDGYVGFHGAGGGGSMMSMDAIQKKGYKIANFCDTSGNPPASKVYRAAKIILSQKNIIGYFGSGSGVASQEQFHSARGLVKAFREECITIPAVIRLGGNAEDVAVQILTEYTKDLPALVEGYKKDHTVEFCAERLDQLIKTHQTKKVQKYTKKRNLMNLYFFDSFTGKVFFDHDLCLKCESKICVKKCVPKILTIEDGKPILNISFEEAKKGKCTECLVCEIDCFFQGNKGGFVELPIENLNDYRKASGIMVE